MFAAFQNLDLVCLVLVVDDGAFRGGRIAHAAMFQFQQLRDGGPVKRAQAVESGANLIDLLPLSLSQNSGLKSQ